MGTSSAIRKAKFFFIIVSTFRWRGEIAKAVRSRIPPLTQGRHTATSTTYTRAALRPLLVCSRRRVVWILLCQSRGRGSGRREEKLRVIKKSKEKCLHRQLCESTFLNTETGLASNV